MADQQNIQADAPLPRWSKGDPITADRLNVLQDRVSSILPTNLPSGLLPVRFCKTCADDDGSYPEAGDHPNVYPVKFVHVTYTKTAGQQTRDVVEIFADREGPDDYVMNLADSDDEATTPYIEESSLIEAFALGGSYFTRVTTTRATGIQFELAEELTTAKESCCATITVVHDGFAPLADDACGSGQIKVYNLMASGGDYVFEGSVGARGVAVWNSIDARYVIVQLECPG